MADIVEIVTQHVKFADVPNDMQDVARGIAVEYGADPETIEIVRKCFVGVKEPLIKEGERAVIATISTEAVDRDNEVMKLKGADLKWFRKNPVVLYGHSYGSLPIGKAQWVRKDGAALVAKTVFASAEANPVADQVYNLFKEGILKAWSVGFIVIESREANQDEFDVPVSRVITKWALLEYSAVPVPSNMEALTTAIGKGLVLSDEVKAGLGMTPGIKRYRLGECIFDGQTDDPNKATSDTAVEDEPTIREPDPRIDDIITKMDEMAAVMDRLGKMLEPPAPVQPVVEIVPSEPDPAPVILTVPSDLGETISRAIAEGFSGGIAKAAAEEVDKARGQVKEL